MRRAGGVIFIACAADGGERLNAIAIWVIFPGLASILIYLLRRREIAVHITGMTIALALAVLAWRLPISKPLPLHLWSTMPAINISSSLPFLGAIFILENSLRPALAIIYLTVGFWCGGAYAARAGRYFTPIGLAIAALLSACLAIRPSSLAALLIELIILLCTPLFSPPGQPVRHGIRRFLTFQTLGMAVILVADYFLATVSLQNRPTSDLRLAMLAVGLGFALVLPIVPFHSWIPMLAGETNTYSAAFICYLLPSSVAFLLFDFLIRYTGTGIAPEIFAALRTIGALMVVSGGLWAIFENHLGRLLGFVAIQQIGANLLALSLNENASPSLPLMGVFFAQLLPSGLGMAVYALSLCSLQQRQSLLTLDDIAGRARSHPIAAAGLVLSLLSLAGLPLLASFPACYVLWSALAHNYPSLGLLAVLGSAFLFIAGVRVLSALTRAPISPAWHMSENRLQSWLIGIGLAALFVIGLSPQILLPYLVDMAVLLSNPFP